MFSGHPTGGQTIMKRLMLAAAAGAAFALSACDPMMSDPEPASSAGRDMTPEEAMPFAMMAGASDLYEIESARLALRKSQRQDVRQFAQMLIEHHTMTTQQVMAAARTSGFNPPPPQLLPMQRNMLDRLSEANGAEFDRRFWRQQVRAHEMALALHENYARNGDRPPLRAAAGGAVPIVSQHLQQARRMHR
jgi:putative membrane protein